MILKIVGKILSEDVIVLMCVIENVSLEVEGEVESGKVKVVKF